MVHKNDLGRYIAERLVYFKRGYENLDKLPSGDFVEASKEGKIIISVLEFKIKTFDKTFIMDVQPVIKSDWNQLKNHFQNLEEFWHQDKNLQNMKKHIDNISVSVHNKRQMVVDDSKIRIKGVFWGYNDSVAYNYVLYALVKPFLFYKFSLK